MKIAVCLKRVPDTTAKIVIGASRTAIDETGVKFVPNPYDEFALEAAIALKEQAGAGRDHRDRRRYRRVPGDAADGPGHGHRPRRAAAVAGSADGLAVARALAAELKAGGYDLILFGKLAVDDYNHQVGVMVAELLELPCITAAAKMTLTGSAIEAEREIEGGVEVMGCSLPAVVTCDKGLNNPRLPSLKGIMAAKKKPLDTKPVTLEAAIVRGHQPGTPGRTPGGTHRRRGCRRRSRPCSRCCATRPRSYEGSRGHGAARWRAPQGVARSARGGARPGRPVGRHAWTPSCSVPARCRAWTSSAASAPTRVLHGDARRFRAVLARRRVGDHRVDRRRVRCRWCLRPRQWAGISLPASLPGSALPARPTSRRSASRAVR